MRGGWEIFTRNVGGWFYNGRDGKFLKSLYLVGRWVLTLLFYEEPPYIAYYLFFKFCPTLPHFRVTSSPYSHCSFCCPVCLISCAILRNDNMDLHMSSLVTLVPEVPSCILCNKAPSLLRSDTCGFLLVLWFDITHTKHTQHTRGPVNLHTHINIYFNHLLCAHSSYLHYNKWLMHNSLISKIYSSQCLFL